MYLDKLTPRYAKSWLFNLFLLFLMLNKNPGIQDLRWKTRWWFQRFVIFIPLPGEMIRFDQYFSNGLVQPSTRNTSTSFRWKHFPTQAILGSYKTTTQDIFEKPGRRLVPVGSSVASSGAAWFCGNLGCVCFVHCVCCFVCIPCKVGPYQL